MGSRKREEQDRLSCLVKDTIMVLSKDGLTFKKNIKIQGVLGITVDDNEVFIVHMNDTIHNPDMVSDKAHTSTKRPHSGRKRTAKRRRQSSQSSDSEMSKNNDKDSSITIAITDSSDSGSEVIEDTIEVKRVPTRSLRPRGNKTITSRQGTKANKEISHSELCSVSDILVTDAQHAQPRVQRSTKVIEITPDNDIKQESYQTNLINNDDGLNFAISSMQSVNDFGVNDPVQNPLVSESLTNMASTCAQYITGLVTNTAVKQENIQYETPNNAIAGDVLVLTKPLGTQVAINCHQWLDQPEDWNRIKLTVAQDDIRKAYERATLSMARSNKTAARLMHKYNAHGAIEICGKGLLDHANDLALIQQNEVGFVIHNLPIIAKMATVSKACKNVPNFGLLQGNSPETSGGLLMALPREQAVSFCKDVEKQDGHQAWIVGIVEAGNRAARILVKPRVIEVPAKETEGQLW